MHTMPGQTGVNRKMGDNEMLDNIWREAYSRTEIY